MQQMPRVEFIYDTDCPNVEAARANLLDAFGRTGLPPQWHEWDRARPDTPGHLRGYGSPTILVDSLDVTGAASGEGADCCRIYTDETGALTGVPPVEMIATRLRNTPQLSDSSSNGSRWRSMAAAAPAVGAALLPKLTCPACWPAYAGLLGALGLGFFDYTPFLFPLTLAFLVLAVSSLGYRARRRRGYRPLDAGIGAATVLLIGRFVFASDGAMYGGMALLIGASAWNSWPRRKPQTDSCPVCTPTL